MFYTTSKLFPRNVYTCEPLWSQPQNKPAKMHLCTSVITSSSGRASDSSSPSHESRACLLPMLVWECLPLKDAKKSFFFSSITFKKKEVSLLLFGTHELFFLYSIKNNSSTVSCPYLFMYLLILSLWTFIFSGHITESLLMQPMCEELMPWLVPGTLWSWTME